MTDYTDKDYDDIALAAAKKYNDTKLVTNVKYAEECAQKVFDKLRPGIRMYQFLAIQRRYMKLIGDTSCDW